MKKLLVIAILMLALIVTVVACNNDVPTNDTVTTDGETDRATNPEETTAEDVTTEEVTTEEVTTEEVTTEEVTTEEVTTEEVTTEEVTTEEVTTEEVTTEEVTTEEEPAETEPVLVVDKTLYEVGEAIMVTAVGSGTDWVGIGRTSDSGSLFWWYVDSVGSQTAFDLMTTADGSGLTCELAPGEYEIRLIANDAGWNSTGDLIASKSITIVAKSGEAQ